MFSESIGPTYNGLKAYPTMTGGVLTIVVMLILLSWLGLQLSFVAYEEKGKITNTK